MIAFISGKVILLNPESLVVDVQGVGYEVFCSQINLEQMSVNLSVKFFIHTHVREDAFVLFGFLSQGEKELFISLNKVNGVGPKLAMKILSAAPVEYLFNLIESGDVQGLSKIPKVGKKTAEQLVLTLKGKLEFAENKKEAVASHIHKEIFSALVNLGFKEGEVQKIVQEMPPDINFDEGLRKGLSHLSSGV